MKLKRYILLFILFAWAGGCVCTRAYADEPIRYVRPTKSESYPAGGVYTNDGRSWATAKDKVQDAINDLHEYMEQNNLTSGKVYIAAGSYVPTESTESSGGSMLNTSFKIYAGIHVYGGFDPNTPEEHDSLRIMANGKRVYENWADQSGIGTTDGTEISSQWDLRHKTILTGNHTTTPPTFVFDSIRGRYNTAFPASSFHVVWFATNGKFETNNDSTKGHYRPLEYPASLDGCVISSGSASSKSTTSREHTAYGGGVYMVGNCSMRACTVERCYATMRGGGIYCDGGGDIEFCYIHTCQAAGIGVLEGYGGGVCIDYDGSCGHSHITNCAARCGGGLMITHMSDEYPVAERLAAHILPIDTAEVSHYSPFSSASVINNNTANAEGAGIYLAEGGTINHATVCGNNCCGLDVTYYGRRHGRSGGIYVRNCGMIFNSVFWGNRVDVNNDIQFASVRQRNVPQAAGDEQTVYVYHSAFMNHDVTDWTGATKEFVFTLDKSNMPYKGSYNNHPCFFKPTVDPNDWEHTEKDSIYGAGVFLHLKRFVDIPGPRIWHLTSYSAIDQKGVQWSEAVQDVSRWLIHAHTEYGVVSNPYEPASTLGALVRKPDPLVYVLIKPQGLESRKGAAKDTPIPTLFIDPNRKGNYDGDGHFIANTKEGDSWDQPIRDLGEAISFFRRYLRMVDGHHVYRMPKLAGAEGPDSVDYHAVQILVKPGELRTIGPGNYVNKNIRTAAVHMEPHMRLYGGYPDDLTGTSTEGRNPRSYRSRITCNVTGQEGAVAFANNSAHVIAIVNADSVVVDGFMLEDANTQNIENGETTQAGGGVTVNNATIAPANRIDMVGNEIRNCVISNCWSPRAAGVFVNGEYKKGNGDVCYAELKLVNTIIRNNTSAKADDGKKASGTHEGTIVANGRAYIFMDHCDVVNNAGYAFKTEDEVTKNGDEPSGFTGFIRMDNSIVYCNGLEPKTSYLELDSGMVICMDEASQDRVYGSYNVFDADLIIRANDSIHRPHGFFAEKFTLTVPDGFVPAGVTSQLSTDATTFFKKDSSVLNNRAILTRKDVKDKNYPVFQNPSRNIGHTDTGDKPLYGGIVAYSPLNTNPIVNAASRDGHTEVDNFDRSDVIVRDRGGAPDIGAIENSNLPAAGTVLYVTPDGAGKRDGSSWDNAIAGNTIYALNGAGAAGTDALDEANGTTRIINTNPSIGTGAANGVTTDDNRYCGGYSTRYIYPIFTDNGDSIVRDLEIDVYVGGNNPRVDTTDIDTASTTTLSNFKYNNGTIPANFTSTLAPDANYPYGEMSGASRYTYRSAYNYSPYNEAVDAVMLDGSILPYGDDSQRKTSAEKLAASGRLVMRNERIENYVSGLQYAVEKASAANKSLHKDTVQVWVGAGKYTDYKGFVMRDSVSVYGGFPYGKYTSPGMDERQALMSKEVSIPKSATNADKNPEDYETILQISDVNPRKDNVTIKEKEAIKFFDDSAAVKVNIANTVTKVTDHNNIHYHRWDTIRDTTSTYIRYPQMVYGESETNVWTQRQKIDTTGKAANNFVIKGSKNLGGIQWTDGQRVVYAYFGPSWKDPALNDNQGWQYVWEDITGNVDYSNFKFDTREVLDANDTKIDTDKKGMEMSGFMSKMSVWQTMKSVPARKYRMEIDMGAYYTNSSDTKNTGITFYIIAPKSTRDTLIKQPVYCPENKLRRYSFVFDYPSDGDGDLMICMMSSPGTQDKADPTATANQRKISMDNVHLYAVGDDIGRYVEDDDTHKDTVTTKTIHSSSCTEEIIEGSARERKILRKSVLRMPDVTSTVYMHGLGYGDANDRGKYGDMLAHYERVIKEGRQSNVQSNGKTVNGRHQDPNYKEYNNVYWDGFTIRHGFIYNQHMAHSGGAGVLMFEGATLANCIVANNFAGCRGAKGGGVFCDGSTSTIENCFILNNTVTKGKYEDNSQLLGGGLFLYEGTCFNTLIANNYAKGPGGGLGLCVGKFYNNSLAYNKSNANGTNVGGLRVATGSAPAIFMANTIIYGNNGLAIDITNGTSATAPFINCYIQSETAITKDNFLHAINDHAAKVTDGNFGRKNTFLNGVEPSAANTPFAADVNSSGTTYTDSAKVRNDFALRSVDSIHCVNSGEEDFEGAMYEAVRAYLQRADASKNPSDEDIKKQVFYKNVIGATLPSNDVVYAKRVQDCQVDIGAYEFNAAYNIQPDTITHPGKAIFYGAFVSPGGDASARSPYDAACLQKLQLVLDAAGRYKYDLKTKGYYNKGATGDVIDPFVSRKPNKYWSVEVWMQGDDYKSTTESNSDSCEHYTPTRSTKSHIPGTHDNTLDYSFIVPHGIVMKGGFADGFYQVMSKEGDTIMIQANGTVKADTTGQDYWFMDLRDPLTYRSILSGKITSSTGAQGETFHVVTFTNDLYDGNENLIDTISLDILTAEEDRAVLDGLFIMDGSADAPDEVDQIGAGAVVTDYAHIRNCVVQDNEALLYGGGLYLKPFALVSGTIIKNNKAEVGGGIYVEKPTQSQIDADSLARIYTSTVCENTATASAGGIWFDNTNVRVNSSAFWHNEASDNANVSGNFTRTSENTDYPFNFCGVESRRLEGQANIELSPSETEGVRWDRGDPFNTILYYPIEMSSTLSRAGITYTGWDSARAKFPTLDTLDIARVHRARTIDKIARGFAWASTPIYDTLVVKNNDFIDIGARAINKNYEITVQREYVMHRLYVMHTDLINSEAARALQDNQLDNDTANMYRQMGSCIYNPFHRLGDAFDYIIRARKENPKEYRNRVFEVFVEAGTYYPYHNAYGEQDEVRNNTFLIPEAVYVIGGINSEQSDHKYGQEGYYDQFTGAKIGQKEGTMSIRTLLPGQPVKTYDINCAPLDSIRQKGRQRPMRDNNMNSVIEPWELERQTILSGNAVSGDNFTHVYHVITMHADSNHVGPRPKKYYRPNPRFLTHESDTMFVDTIYEDGKKFYNVIPDTVDSLLAKESDLSILARTVELDGLTITGGYANHLDPADTIKHAYVKRTYFRGGGIFIDGLWQAGMSESDLPNATDPSPYNIPIIIENCIFTDNMAGNGGGLYSNGSIFMYGCHFTQNYSEGPITVEDQKFIPWTAGGCVASNAACDISNSLFANNEARRGRYPIVMKGADEIPDADARQGFGGCLSIAGDSKMRVINCHFMKNKAVAYSAIYNFLANNRYDGPNRADRKQYAFNTIFWGNEVFEVDSLNQLPYDVAPLDSSITNFNRKYKASRAGVFHYDGNMWATYERLFHEYDSLYNVYAAAKDTFNSVVTGKLDTLRQYGDSLEGLYFCSYRKGYGPTGMKPTKEGYLLTEAEKRAFTDPRQIPVKLKPDKGSMRENFDSLFTQLHGNNNTLINRINTAADGPNFRQPSYVAGIDGYMQNADWLIARMNLTTDQGWGHLKQNVGRDTMYYITRFTEQYQFPNRQAAADSLTHAGKSYTKEDIMPVPGLPSATFLTGRDQDSTAIYNYYSRHYGAYMSETNTPLPIGEQPYMTYTRTTNESEKSGVMSRISKNPKMGETDVYIDIGIYEYQYVQLDIDGQEIDTMWVATKEKGGGHDGLSWETPTTDLQMAIDLLMSSHNNHDKYICLMGDEEGTFTPTNVLDNRLAFVISSNSLAAQLPDSALADQDYTVKSLNFIGGYSFGVEDAPRDPITNPVVIEMPNSGNKSQLNQLFVVEDMSQQNLQANWQGEYIWRDTFAIPITFDGITFVNTYSERDPNSENEIGGLINKKGGAAIYYRWQRQYNGTDENVEPDMYKALYPTYVNIGGENVPLPKLTLSNCIFMLNGDTSVLPAQRSPAVRIDHGGGSSLIVNSLFHSNAGAPVAARQSVIPEEPNNLAEVPNDVVVVNSTFALNGGHLTLESENSEVHNSLIWYDDLMNIAKDSTTQLEIGKGATLKRWGNAIDGDQNREGIEGKVTNNAFWRCFRAGDETCHNDSLATDNTDVFNGPCFVQPNLTASNDTARRARNFGVNPGVKTMNRGDTALYKSKVFFREYPYTSGPENYWRRPGGFKDAYINSIAEDYELAGKSRIHGRNMERGAYECRAVLQRVIYTDLRKPADAERDGSSWDKAFGGGQLQKAIDAAAVYTYLTAGSSAETRRSYVYVKGSNTSEESVDIEARDGVNMFGSIPVSFMEEAYLAPDSEYLSNAECRRYVNYVRAITPGVGSPNNTTPARINSFKTGENPMETGMFVSGFVFTNPGETLTESPLNIDDPFVIIRNCIFTGNKMAGDAPVANVQKGFLYNNLFYGDTANTEVRLREGGLALNNTVVVARDGAVPIDVTNAADSAALNNIALWTDTAKCFAPYLTNKNPYPLSDIHYLNKPVLAYQLHEHSGYINAGIDTAKLPAVYTKYKLAKVLNMGEDRDILGNPRMMGDGIDVGALETWYVNAGKMQELTGWTSGRDVIGKEAALAAAGTPAGVAKLYAAFTENYGGHMYPHPGSVVYLMDSAAMSMDDDEDAFKDFHNVTIPLQPGYVMLKPGASFYGNGNKLQFAYLAAEKRFKNQQYSMTAFPFDYSKANITMVSYDDEADTLGYQLSPLNFATYTYNGAARSAKDYVFQTNNSTLWTTVGTPNRTATEGYLMDFGRTVTDTTLRFTAFAEAHNEYVYTEGDDSVKYVYLTQYDNRDASGAVLNFTRQEDMGWNMKGLPWLVSDYRTDTTVDGYEYLRQMYIPHVLYQMDGDGEYLVERDKIYSSRSWASGSVLSMGNAFLTQTATTKAQEAVTFHQPYIIYNDKKPARPLLMVSNNRSQITNGLSSDILTVTPDENAPKTVSYSYGRDAIKWIASTDEVQIYLLDTKRLSRISLLGSAPTEVDIPLGIYVPTEMDYTFSLPEKEAFDGYEYVWLIDYKQNRFINLLFEDYEVTLEPGEHNNRFAVRIGGFPKTDNKGKRDYIVFAANSTLFVRGLVDGDMLTVYAPDGKLIYRTTASSSEFSMPLYYQTGYLVRVNDKSYKVVNQ